MGDTKPARVIGPAARMRCRRCGRVFTVKPGHRIVHDRRQGALYVHCDGDLVADVAAKIESARAGTGTGTSGER